MAFVCIEIIYIRIISHVSAPHQANMDPKHRDKVAFVRVVSGEFKRGMKVTLERRGGRNTLIFKP